MVPWGDLGLSADRATSLEFLGCDVGKSPALLDLLGSFPKLRHVELYLLGDNDLFGRLPDGVEYAFINSTGPKFAFGHIARLRALKGLSYLWARGEVDCEALAALPSLTELKLNSCKKIRGIEALLASKSLRECDASGIRVWRTLSTRKTRGPRCFISGILLGNSPFGSRT